MLEQTTIKSISSHNAQSFSQPGQLNAAKASHFKKAAVADIHDRASELASTVAARILQREISSDDQARLVEESIRELDAAGA